MQCLKLFYFLNSNPRNIFSAISLSKEFPRNKVRVYGREINTETRIQLCTILIYQLATIPIEKFINLNNYHLLTRIISYEHNLTDLFRYGVFTRLTISFINLKFSLKLNLYEE